MSYPSLGRRWVLPFTTLAICAFLVAGCDSGGEPPAEQLDPPANLQAGAVGQSVELSWQAPPGVEVSEYRIYRGGEPERVATVPGDQTGYTDTDVQAGQAYRYVVTAALASGDESGFSNEATATPESDPDPDPDPTGAQECIDGMAGEYPCENIDLLAHLSINEVGGSTGVNLNEVWGWTDPETGRRYALVGRTDGTAFVDVTEPIEPVFLGSLPTATSSSSWRDIKVKDDHALIGSEARGHGMQIFDLTQLRDAEDDAPQTFESTAVYDGFGASHNIVAAGEGMARAYGVGISNAQDAPDGADCGPGYHGVDLSDPSDPQFAGCFNSTLGRASDGYTHDAQCVDYFGPDTEHQGREICIGADETGLSVADLTDLENPEQLAVGTYPNTGYAHQGWFGEEQRYFYADDELDERNGLVSNTRTLVWDMQDLDDPVLVTQHEGVTTSIDHNQYLVGGFAYQANYRSGLRILDARDPENLSEIGFFDIYPSDDGAAFDGAWGTYPFFDDGTVLINGIGSGLFIVQPIGDAER
jgi:choice-of-anchor B domain-containing protein